MSEPADHGRIKRRAELLPEEQEAGSDNPEEQAEAILRDSDERVDDPQGTRRRSTQTPDEPPAGKTSVDNAQPQRLGHRRQVHRHLEHSS